MSFSFKKFQIFWNLGHFDLSLIRLRALYNTKNSEKHEKFLENFFHGMINFILCILIEKEKAEHGKKTRRLNNQTEDSVSLFVSRLLTIV